MKTKLKKGIEIFFTYLSILFITFPFFLNLDRRIISFFLFFFRFDSFRSLLYRILVLEEYFVHFFIDNRNYILILFILYLFNDHLHFNILLNISYIDKTYIIRRKEYVRFVSCSEIDYV